jgi:uncharacterized membrane protein YgcG
MSPYSTSYTGFKYHYFDAVQGVLRHHSFDLAYEMLRQMAHWPCAGAKVTLHDEPSGTLNVDDRERAQEKAEGGRPVNAAVRKRAQEEAQGSRDSGEDGGGGGDSESEDGSEGGEGGSRGGGKKRWDGDY